MLSGAVPLRGEAAERGSVAASSQMKQTEVQSSAEVAYDEQRLARDWGLNTDEWARYRQLMRGPLGVYSPHLDPLTALGIEAQSADERRRYAELQVQAEARRVEKMLAYQRAYDEAWKRLYPALQPLSSPAPRRPNLIARLWMRGERDRLAVFVKDQCPPCDERVRQLQAENRSFDVYVVGTRGDDARVRQWAARAGVDPEKVRARAITLNHDDGRWLAIRGQGELPAVMREVGGQWVRE
jgi:integrating conjugative element protein (TIGR03759 family)